MRAQLVPATDQAVACIMGTLIPVPEEAPGSGDTEEYNVFSPDLPTFQDPLEAAEEMSGAGRSASSEPPPEEEESSPPK